jgi:hypothetical protein
VTTIFEATIGLFFVEIFLKKTPFQAILSTFRFFKKKTKKLTPPEPYDNSFWEKSNPAERKRDRKKEREITPLIVDT